MNAQAMSAPPMLYQDLQRLDPAVHLALGLRSLQNFQHAAKINAVPLGIREFTQAAAHFPIVFGPAGQTAFPVAVTGLIEGTNLFVEDNGAWAQNTYLPGYLKRFPFWMRLEDQGQSASIWFDPTAHYVVPLEQDSDAKPLFNFRGEPNDALMEIIHFCQFCLQDETATAQFMAALEKENLLVSRQADIQLPDGSTYQLSGFRVVDVEAYHQLPDATLAQWVRNGWAALVAVHLWTQANGWGGLMKRHAQRAPAIADRASRAVETEGAVQ